MPVITLPDGSQRVFPNPVSVLDVARDIGPGLAKATLAGEVNGRLVDATRMIHEDASLRIITDKDSEGLEIIRHSCAHLLAQSVKILFPTAQVTIGPVVENGFYYDFSFERPFTPEDLETIEKQMIELAAMDLPVERVVKDRDDAVAFFLRLGESYKAEIIKTIPADEEITLYRQGDFIDLCRGPHIPRTGKLQAFKLTKLAGAYWRGDPANAMLQRIYGTAWADKKALNGYLKSLEEAEKRDHRKLGRRLDLFHFQEEAPGMPFWHARGWTVYRLIEEYIREKLRHHAYQEVHTPQVIDRILWEKSGHMDKFSHDMFMTSSENREYAIKPMNCPAHIQIYNQGLKSYRDLPLRMAEFGCCHRNEQSGALHGLMRVRTMTQDDAHIFCTEEQIQDEVSRFIDLLYEVYADFGFNEILIRLATRPTQRVGSDAVWDKAERALATALNEKGLTWAYNHGEGAFYGPKIEFSLKDSLARVWQCGTIQVDFSMPGRLGAQYINERSEKDVPVMLHRAVLGSLERFIGILIEEYAGAFPPWLAPVQAVVLSITEKQVENTEIIAKTLKNQGFRVETDLRNETIGLKIRDHAIQRVPYQIIIGAREVELNVLAVRTRAGDDLGAMTIQDFSDRLKSDIACRGRNILEV
ncbi:MAG: threonine--tRNA ligase [Gammaproteobacteria bacterium RIFCSPLOWO2_02_FULL_56_15]|nr:MAG: threonine--tRNA ligase [Gammaproteobacteria bacterium RIFCSPLOWO2_02_FULL_56_15]